MSNELPCLCGHPHWLHLSFKGAMFRGRCVGEHRVLPGEVPADTEIGPKERRWLKTRGYVVFECKCPTYHTVEIPDAPVLFDSRGRKIYGA